MRRCEARLWDRVADGYLTTAVQKIVGDALRPADAKDPHGVSQAHTALELAYATLDRQLNGRDHDGWLAGDDFTLAEAAPQLRLCATPAGWSIRWAATRTLR